MLLTAQRVLSSHGEQGINAFCYLHGGYGWLGEAPPEIRSHPGELINSHIEIRPPGNRVRSYLDILTPDMTPSSRIYAEIVGPIQLVADTQPLPWRAVSGDTTFTFAIEGALASGWYSELTALLNHALAVRAPH